MTCYVDRTARRTLRALALALATLATLAALALPVDAGALVAPTLGAAALMALRARACLCADHDDRPR